MILESIVTTVDAAGHVNVAPMGPRVDAAMRTWTLRPFTSSRTYANLRATGRAVVHVTDDVLLLARAAIGPLDPPPVVEPRRGGDFWVLPDACRWYALEVRSWSDDAQRPDAACRVVEAERQRDFFGLNRAKHAVVEAAVLATRVHLLDPDEIRRQLDRLAPLVEKTGGPDEDAAFALVREHIDRAAANPGGRSRNAGRRDPTPPA